MVLSITQRTGDWATFALAGPYLSAPSPRQRLGGPLHGATNTCAQVNDDQNPFDCALVDVDVGLRQSIEF